MFRFIQFCAGALLIACIPFAARAAVLTVPGQYGTIQAALDAAGEGDEIVVSPGRYPETIQFKGPSVVLRSSDPLSTPVVAATIIDANHAGPAVTFVGTESAACRLSGLTLLHGEAPIGGGIVGNNTLATVENNWITSNTAVGEPIEVGNGGGVSICRGLIHNNFIAYNSATNTGGGLYQCDGTITGNLIKNNAARFGGGIEFCDGLIEGNTVTSNTASIGGGGLHGCAGTIERNVIRRNAAANGGSGLLNCGGTIRNNIINGNVVISTSGGAINRCNGTIANNTIYGNRGRVAGGGIYDCTSGTLVNCIVWANQSRDNTQIFGSSPPVACDIQNWPGGGTGNISLDPLFVNAPGGDFHLTALSPCIDAGAGAPGVTDDFEGDPRPFDYKAFDLNGTNFDIGADEFYFAPSGADGVMFR